MSLSSRTAIWLAALAAICLGGAAAFTYLVLADDSTNEQSEAGATGDQSGTPETGGRTIVAPDQAGGYARVQLSFLTAGDEARVAQLAAAGLRNPATAHYHEPGTAPEPVVTFSGGELSPALAEDDVAGTAETKLAEAFARLPYESDGTMRTFDAGPLGGQVRCTTLTSSDRQPVACGWVDRWTTGTIVDVRRGRTEAQVAELLVAMRPDFEVTRQ
jgi:hypothetical protein